MAEFAEEAYVRLVGDLLPLDVVEVALELAEALDFKHAAEDSGELRCEEDLALVLWLIDIHCSFFACWVKGYEAVLRAAGHVVPLGKEGLRLVSFDTLEMWDNGHLHRLDSLGRSRQRRTASSWTCPSSRQFVDR